MSVEINQHMLHALNELKQSSEKSVNMARDYIEDEPSRHQYLIQYAPTPERTKMISLIQDIPNAITSIAEQTKRVNKIAMIDLNVPSLTQVELNQHVQSIHDESDVIHENCVDLSQDLRSTAKNLILLMQDLSKPRLQKVTYSCFNFSLFTSSGMFGHLTSKQGTDAKSLLRKLYTFVMACQAYFSMIKFAHEEIFECKKIAFEYIDIHSIFILAHLTDAHDLLQLYENELGQSMQSLQAVFQRRD